MRHIMLMAGGAIGVDTRAVVGEGHDAYSLRILAVVPGTGEDGRLTLEDYRDVRRIYKSIGRHRYGRGWRSGRRH